MIIFKTADHARSTQSWYQGFREYILTVFNLLSPVAEMLQTPDKWTPDKLQMRGSSYLYKIPRFQSKPLRDGCNKLGSTLTVHSVQWAIALGSTTLAAQHYFEGKISSLVWLSSGCWTVERMTLHDGLPPAFRTASDKSWAWRPGNKAMFLGGQGPPEQAQLMQFLVCRSSSTQSAVVHERHSIRTWGFPTGFFAGGWRLKTEVCKADGMWGTPVLVVSGGITFLIWMKSTLY